MFARLPPVGHAVTIKRDFAAASPIVAGYDAVFVQSGTAALALALQAAAKAAAVANPKVLIPAYACPDLVSAAVFAGVRPELVDLEADSTYMSLSALQSQLGPSTVAVIAVNFLGIPERLAEIAALLHASGIALIEDNAQWFPPPGSELSGDYAVLSFGRGKPVGLLGGGVLLCRRPVNSTLVPEQTPPDGVVNKLKTLSRFVLYNTLRHPLFYGMLDRLPFLKIGATEYKSLTAVQRMDSFHASFLPANINTYLRRGLEAQQQICAMLARLSKQGIIDLAVQQHAAARRLLRYPLLVKSARQRNDLLPKLRSLGAGASALYGQSLPNIDRVNALIDCSRGIDNAQSFAERLITLPVHDQVTVNHVDMIYDCLAS